MVKILLIEDDQLLRELYAETLTAESYQVETAADGEEGLAKMSQDGWDLVLVDIILPKLSGLEIVEKLKNEKGIKPGKKVIFLTNLDKENEIKKAGELGDGYLIKSQMNPGEFVEKVKSILSS